MKRLFILLVAAACAGLVRGQPAEPEYGPAAALAFALSYRGQTFVPGVLNCHPDAKGIPFSDTKNIIPMNPSLWTPAELAADFRVRMAALKGTDRKRGIIVMIKTERCCTKEYRACTVTTAALEKRATPLVAEFLIYGAWIKPRDGDNPPGSRRIEQGADEWKNDAAKVYEFEQGPGAKVVIIDPKDGSIIERTDALKLGLYRDRIRRKPRPVTQTRCRADKSAGAALKAPVPPFANLLRSGNCTPAQGRRDSMFGLAAGVVS